MTFKKSTCIHCKHDVFFVVEKWMHHKIPPRKSFKDDFKKVMYGAYSIPCGLPNCSCNHPEGVADAAITEIINKNKAAETEGYPKSPCKNCRDSVYFVKDKWLHKSEQSLNPMNNLVKKAMWGEYSVPCGVPHCGCIRPDGFTRAEMKEKIDELKSKIANRKPKSAVQIFFAFIAAFAVIAVASLALGQPLENTFWYGIIGGAFIAYFYQADLNKEELQKYESYMKN